MSASLNMYKALSIRKIRQKYKNADIIQDTPLMSPLWDFHVLKPNPKPMKEPYDIKVGLKPTKISHTLFRPTYGKTCYATHLFAISSCVYLPDGQLTFENRYDIRGESFFHIRSDHNYTPSEMFQKFIQEVNSQVPYNDGKINTVRIITYHDLTYNIQDYNKAATTVPLFDQEMQYLHDNGFKVLLLNQFAFRRSSE